jgi:predicted transposase YbfD/YdcC
MKKFEATFGALSDPRAGNARHNLLEVVFIALAATLCGAQSCVDMALFARSKEGFLREIVEMPHGPPSHDTFSRVFRLLEPEAFEAAFMAFTRAFGAKIAGVVAIDGKALRGAYARGARSCPLHLVNVWAAEARLVVAQRVAPGRNEVQGVLDALAFLDLDGCIVTADALHCRKDVAAAIKGAGGDYALSVKANQPRLLAEAERLLDAAPRDLAISDVEDRHDRAEVRRASVASAPDLEEFCGFPGACAVARVEAVRHTADGAETVSTRFFILSAHLSAERLANVVRAHWSIENNLHWTLDVALGEDAARNRAGHGAQNLSLLRKLALNIIKADDEKGSLKGKLKRAGWDDAFLTKLLAHMR